MAKISDYAPLDLVKLEFENYAGEVTGEFINVRRIDSKAVRDAMHQYHESIVGSETSPSEEAVGLALMTALIDSWSFSEEITSESVSGLMDLYPRTATFPGIDAKILEASANKANFIKKKPAVNNPSVSVVEAG